MQVTTKTTSSTKKVNSIFKQIIEFTYKGEKVSIPFPKSLSYIDPNLDTPIITEIGRKLYLHLNNVGLINESIESESSTIFEVPCENSANSTMYNCKIDMQLMHNSINYVVELRFIYKMLDLGEDKPVELFISNLELSYFLKNKLLGLDIQEGVESKINYFLTLVHIKCLINSLELQF